jgi:hypothetical protein
MSDKGYSYKSSGYNSQVRLVYFPQLVLGTILM